MLVSDRCIVCNILSIKSCYSLRFSHAHFHSMFCTNVGSKNETLHMNARRVGSASCIELKPSAYALHDVTHHLTMFRINLCTDDDGTVVFCSASK